MAAIAWNGVDGDWGLAADWSTGAVPTSADDVSILAPGSYLVTVDSADVASSLNFDASQAALFEGAGSLTISGALTVDSGFVSLNEANTIGGVSVGAATLAIGASGALGTGVVAVNGGELLGTANAAFANALALSGNVTIAAANGTTLNENASSYQLAANTTLNFGGPGEGGTIIWHTGAGSVVPALGDITIQAGALIGADSRFASIFGNSPQTTVAAGATLDLGGYSATLHEPLGAGTVTDSGAAATLTLGATNLSGAISGSLSLAFDGDASLSGTVTMTGGATLNGPVTVTNGGTYDIVANVGVAGSSGSQFINNGLFEKTGGTGVSTVTTNFVNNGVLDVLSGSLVFSGGFTNNGVINGPVTQSGGITTIGAPVSSDLSGDGAADTPTPSRGVTALPPATPSNFSVLDTTTNTPFQANEAAYSGPVAGLQWEFIDPTTDNLNVTANVPNVFIHTGSGQDAINVSHSNGNNVLDGSTGSNFLVGGTGNDTFFVDDRGPSADIWSTVSNFHAGDAATIFGITQSGFHTSWVNGQGAAGFTGLTLHVTGGGHPTASLTLPGFSTADLSNGRISTSWGREADGTPYLYVHANS